MGVWDYRRPPSLHHVGDFLSQQQSSPSFFLLTRSGPFHWFGLTPASGVISLKETNISSSWYYVFLQNYVHAWVIYSICFMIVGIYSLSNRFLLSCKYLSIRKGILKYGHHWQHKIVWVYKCQGFKNYAPRLKHVYMQMYKHAVMYVNYMDFFTTCFPDK